MPQATDHAELTKGAGSPGLAPTSTREPAIAPQRLQRNPDQLSQPFSTKRRPGMFKGQSAGLPAPMMLIE
ncbi:MAG: hypothetical protein EA001_02455 [Oscillatoriales cyanobacterium]|nr:MAG: hypothetical protein EA001_02455 [Oscillatoriales cyanobacterium]